MRFVIGALALSLTTTMFAAVRVALPSLNAADEDGASVSLPIDALRVDVLIRGHLARTTYEVTFRNHLDRDLDGQFSFPLPPDAEVSDLGLYFDGHLRRAVAVERVQARTAYEETVHRRVDPALAEWSASTRAFHFRVYPIPARDTKVVHIAYDQDLTSAPFALDLRHDSPLAAFDLTVDSDGSASSEGLALRRSGNVWSARQRQAPLNVVVRARGDDFEGALAAWSPAEKNWYFSATTRLRSSAQSMPSAPHVTLLYDVSSSAVQRDDRALHAFLTRFSSLQQKGARVTVVPFHVRVDSAFDTDPIALEHRLSSLPRAGATNLITLLADLPEILRRTPPQSRIVLVTDGIQTIGDSAHLARALAVAAAAGRPLTVVNASPSADDNILARIASATGGWNIDLTRTSDAEAADASMRQPTRVVLRPAFPSIREVVPAALTITADTTTIIHARSTVRMSWVPLIIGDVRRDLVIRELVTEEERDLVRRAWARAQLRVLFERGASAEEVRAHGIRFRQLTPQTSLLVLDTWRDYEMYHIPLPPELRAARDAELAEWEKERRRNERPGSITIRRVDPTPHPDAWLIKGVVSDGEYPIPGVTVSMLIAGAPDVNVVSNEDGAFWISMPRRPERFTVRAQLDGFTTISQSYPRGAPNGAVLEVVIRISAVTETITVTAEAPFAAADNTQIAGPRNLSLVTPTVANVITRTPSTPTGEVRFLDYLIARSTIGGDKFLQAQAALAMRDDSPELAVRVLTDLAEAYPDDAPTLRILGRVLDGWGEGDLARMLLERALELAPRETQTWRELMLLAVKEGRSSDLAELQRRFEAASRDERMKQTETALQTELQRRGRDPRIDESSELQVEVMWDANYTDIDLRVIEPDGEEVSYRHRRSKSGGALHDDVTSGYGPETYTLPHMEAGTYQIVLDYFGEDDTRLALHTLAHVIVYVRGERRDYFVALAGEKASVVVATAE